MLEPHKHITNHPEHRNAFVSPTNWKSGQVVRFSVVIDERGKKPQVLEIAFMRLRWAPLTVKGWASLFIQRHDTLTCNRPANVLLENYFIQSSKLSTYGAAGIVLQRMLSPQQSGHSFSTWKSYAWKAKIIVVVVFLIIQTFAYCVISLYCEWKNVTRDGFWFNTFLITVSIKEFLLLLMLWYFKSY